MKQQFNYNQVLSFIDYVNGHPKTTPDFDKIAKTLDLTLAEFNSSFVEWAGVSPKEFLKSVSVASCKRLVQEVQPTLFDTPVKSKATPNCYQVDIEKMTPATYKNGGIELNINYSYADSRFGKLLIASTEKGVCYIAYYDDQQTAFKFLTAKFPKANYVQQSDLFQKNALLAFQDQSSQQPIKLHLKGTDFQLKVWKTLLGIPMGELSTYGKIASSLGNTNASRAVGSAIGSNPIAYLIPCHRVVQGSGNLGGYMWGMTRKRVMIGWEMGRIQRYE